MKTEKESGSHLQVVASSPQTAMAAPSTAAGELAAVAELASALDQERWTVRTRVGEFVQRSAVRFLGSGVAAGLATVVRDDNWQVPLLIAAGCALVSGTSSVLSAVRYRHLFRAKWDESMERLLFRLARSQENRVRAIDAAEHLRIPTGDAERRLESLRARSIVSADVDVHGAVVYVFPAAR